MPNQALSFRYRCVISGKSRKSHKSKHFRYFSMQDQHVLNLSGKRYRTAKIRCRAAGPPQGRRHAGARQGQIHRRFQPARPGLCLDRALQPRPRHHPRHRHQGRQGDAGRARRVDRNRSRRRRLRPLHLRPAAEEPRRHPAAADQPHRADDRQGALCRRSRRLRGGGDAGAGARCRRSRRTRYRAASRRHRRRRSRQARRAAALRPHPQQRRARLPLWRHRQNRRRLRRRGACHKTRHRQYAGRRGVDGAARGAGGLRQSQRALHAAGSDPGRVGQQGDAGEDPQRAERQGPHPHRQCRRIVRNEERQLPRIYLHPARGEDTRPPGEMDR